jgi:hypothetical protein
LTWSLEAIYTEFKAPIKLIELLEVYTTGPIRSHPEGVSAAGLQPSSLSNPLMSCAKAAMPSVIDQIPCSRTALIAMLRSVARI